MTNEFPCLVLVNQALHCDAETMLLLRQLCVNVLCKALLRCIAERLLCLPVFTEGPRLLYCVLALDRLCQGCTLHSRFAATGMFNSNATKEAWRKQSVRE